MAADHGKQPWVAAIEALAHDNTNFRTTVWTGNQLQMTLMSIQPDGEVGLEIHSKTDQYLQVISGTAQVEMGQEKSALDFNQTARSGDGIFVPANTWHNIINTSDSVLQLLSIYAPPQHPAGTVHTTYEDDPEHS